MWCGQGYTVEVAFQLGLGGKGREDISVKGMIKQGPQGRWECPVWPGFPGLKPEVPREQSRNAGKVQTAGLSTRRFCLSWR